MKYMLKIAILEVALRISHIFQSFYKINNLLPETKKNVNKKIKTGFSIFSPGEIRTLFTRITTCSKFATVTARLQLLLGEALKIAYSSVHDRLLDDFYDHIW